MSLKLQILSVKGAQYEGECRHKLAELTIIRLSMLARGKKRSYKVFLFFGKGVMAEVIASGVCDIIRIWGGVAVGFICHPRSDSFPGGITPDGKSISAVYAYPLVDNDHGSVVLTPNGSNPVTWTTATDVENYGNNDWLGDDGTVLSWRGPSGRDLPFNFSVSVPGYTIGDGEDNLGNPFYTVFQPLIYQAGEVFATAPQVGTTPPKVLGAAFVSDGKGNTFLISIINNNYQNMTNPAGANGGFFNETWLNGGSDKLYDAVNNPGGWRRIGYIQGGRPTNNWFFSGNGKAALNGNQTMAVSDDLTIVTFGTVVPVYGSKINYQSSNQAGQTWGFTESGQWPGNNPDYNKDTETGLILKLSGSEGTINNFTATTTNQDLVLYNNGALVVEVFTITLGVGASDPWGMGLAIVQNTTVQGVNCGCSAPVDTWSRKGFNPAANCTVDGDNRSVTATRTISCTGVADAVATITVDYGPNEGTGMGWVQTAAVTYPETTGSGCYGEVFSCCQQSGNVYSSGPTMYWENVECLFVNPGHDCTITPVTPLGSYTACSPNTYTMTCYYREQYTWACLADYSSSLWYFTIHGNYGPAYVP